MQDVSSAEMKTLYATVLSGQIERPGSVSLLVLDVLKNLDPHTAKLFQTLCSTCIYLVTDFGAFIDARVPVLNETAGSNALSQFGLSFNALNLLHEHGLIIAEYDSWYDYRFCILRMESGKEFAQLLFRFQGRLWALEPTIDRPPSQEFHLPGVALSQAGRELSRAVEIQPMDAFANHLKKDLKSKSLRMVPGAWTLRAGRDPVLGEGRWACVRAASNALTSCLRSVPPSWADGSGLGPAHTGQPSSQRQFRRAAVAWPVSMAGTSMATVRARLGPSAGAELVVGHGEDAGFTTNDPIVPDVHGP